MITNFRKTTGEFDVVWAAQYCADFAASGRNTDVVVRVQSADTIPLDVEKTTADVKRGVEALQVAMTTTPRPKIIVISGSSKFVDIMAVTAWVLERDEHAITMGLHLLPSWYSKAEGHLAEAEGVAAGFDALHLRKIELADEVFCVDFGDYIGDSTRKELAHATALGRPIRYYTHDPVGALVGDILRKAMSVAEAGEKEG